MMRSFIDFLGITTCLLFIFRVVTYYYVYFRCDRNDVEDLSADKKFKENGLSLFIFSDLFIDFKFYIPEKYKGIQQVSYSALKLFYFSVTILMAMILLEILLGNSSI